MQMLSIDISRNYRHKFRKFFTCVIFAVAIYFKEVGKYTVSKEYFEGDSQPQIHMVAYVTYTVVEKA